MPDAVGGTHFPDWIQDPKTEAVLGSSRPALRDVLSCLTSSTLAVMKSLYAICGLDWRSITTELEGTKFAGDPELLLQKYNLAMGKLSTFPAIDADILSYNTSQMQIGNGETDINNVQIQSFANKIVTYNAQVAVFNANLSAINAARALQGLPALAAMSAITLPPSSSDPTKPQLLEKLPDPRGTPVPVDDPLAMPPTPTPTTINPLVDACNAQLTSNLQLSATYNALIATYNANVNTFNSEMFSFRDVPGLSFTFMKTFNSFLIDSSMSEAGPFIQLQLVSNNVLDTSLVTSNDDRQVAADEELEQNNDVIQDFGTKVEEYNTYAELFNEELTDINLQRTADGLPPFEPLVLYTIPDNIPKEPDGKPSPLTPYPVIDISDAENSGISPINQQIAAYNNSLYSMQERVSAISNAMQSFETLRATAQTYSDYVVPIWGWNDFPPTPMTESLSATALPQEIYTTWHGFQSGGVTDLDAAMTAQSCEIHPYNDALQSMKTEISPLIAYLTAHASQLTAAGIVLPPMPNLADIKALPPLLDQPGPTAGEMATYHTDLQTLYPNLDLSTYSNDDVLVALYLHYQGSETPFQVPYSLSQDDFFKRAIAIRDAYAANASQINALQTFIQSYNSRVDQLNNLLPGPGGSDFTTIDIEGLVGALPVVNPKIPPTRGSIGDVSPDLAGLPVFVLTASPTQVAQSASVEDKSAQARTAMELLEFLKRLLGKGPILTEANTAIEIAAPGAGGFLRQAAGLSAQNMGSVLLNASNQEIARAIIADLAKTNPGTPLPTAAQVVQLVDIAALMTLNTIAPRAATDAVRLAGPFLGPQLSMKDPALLVFAALSRLEYTIGIIGAGLLKTQISGLIGELPGFQTLAPPIRDRLTELVTPMLTVVLSNVALLQVSTLIGSEVPLAKAIQTLLPTTLPTTSFTEPIPTQTLGPAVRETFTPPRPTEKPSVTGREPLRDKEPRKETPRPVETRGAAETTPPPRRETPSPTPIRTTTLSTDQEAPIREALSKAVATRLEGRLTPQHQEELVNRFLSDIFGPSLVLAPTTRAGENKEHADKVATEQPTVLPSLSQQLITGHANTLNIIRQTDTVFAEKTHENYRKQPITVLSTDLGAFFERTLSTEFPYEAMGGGITYRSDTKARNIKPPDALFQA